MAKFETASDVASRLPVEFSTARKETPAYLLPSILVAALLPTALALVGALGGLLFAWTFDLPARQFGTGGAFVSLSFGLWLVLSQFARWVFAVEEITGRDIDGDGQVGAPHYVQYEIQKSEGHSVRGALPVSDPLLREWCAAAGAGQSLSVASWYKRFDKPDGTGGRAEYAAFRAALAAGGLAQEVGGNVGLSLTPLGWQFVRGLLNAEPTPLLDSST